MLQGCLNLLYYSHLVQAPSGKTSYIIHLLKQQPSLLQPLHDFWPKSARACINTGLSIVDSLERGKSETCVFARNSREGKSTLGVGNPCAPHPLNESLGGG